MNKSKCNVCVHRDKHATFYARCCRVTCFTMFNSSGECIWFEKGESSDKPLNIKLARKRMNGAEIWFSTSNKDDGN